MTVKCPIAFFTRNEFQLPHLAHGDVLRNLISTRALWCGPAICSGDEKFMAMEVNRVVSHGEITNTDSDLIV